MVRAKFCSFEALDPVGKLMAVGRFTKDFYKTLYRTVV